MQSLHHQDGHSHFITCGVGDFRDPCFLEILAFAPTSNPEIRDKLAISIMNILMAASPNATVTPPTKLPANSQGVINPLMAGFIHNPFNKAGAISPVEPVAFRTLKRVAQPFAAPVVEPLPLSSNGGEFLAQKRPGSKGGGGDFGPNFITTIHCWLGIPPNGGE